MTEEKLVKAVRDARRRYDEVFTGNDRLTQEEWDAAYDVVMAMGRYIDYLQDREHFGDDDSWFSTDNIGVLLAYVAMFGLLAVWAAGLYFE